MRELPECLGAERDGTRISRAPHKARQQHVAIGRAPRKERGVPDRPQDTHARRPWREKSKAVELVGHALARIYERDHRHGREFYAAQNALECWICSSEKLRGYVRGRCENELLRFEGVFAGRTSRPHREPAGANPLNGDDFRGAPERRPELRGQCLLEN